LKTKHIYALADCEDAAFAFIHGLHLGARKSYVADNHDMTHYNEVMVFEAFIDGIKTGLKNQGKLLDAEFDILTGQVNYWLDSKLKF
jgi:hypothetical protein